MTAPNETSRGAALPEINTCSSFEEFRLLADRTLNSQEKMIYFVGAVENIASVFSEEYERDYYIPTRLERGIGLKLLIPDSPLLSAYQEQDRQQDRETRPLSPELMQMTGSFMIHDDTVVFFGPAEENYAIEMQAPSMARSLKAMFNDAWKRAERCDLK